MDNLRRRLLATTATAAENNSNTADCETGNHAAVDNDDNDVYFIGVHKYDDPNERLRRSLRGKNKDDDVDGDDDGNWVGLSLFVVVLLLQSSVTSLFC